MGNQTQSTGIGSKKSTLGSALRLNYLYIEKYIFPSTWDFPETRIPYSMFRYILSGSAKFVINGKTHVVKKGQVIYIPDGSTLGCQALEEFAFISIRFTSSIPMEPTGLWQEQFGLKYVVDCEDKYVLDYFNKMLIARDSQKPGRYHEINGYLDLIMAYMLNSGSQNSEEETDELRTPEDKDLFSLEEIAKRNIHSNVKMDLRILTVVEYLIMHQNEKIHMKDLYRIADLSPSSFRRVFSMNTGKTPGKFIQDLKMASAAKRLISGNERISDIAMSLGYDDQNYFSRQFKNNFGVSPSQYRKLSIE